MNTPNNSVEDLFSEEKLNKTAAAVILDHLGQYGIRNLAYDEDIGCNPGYIFRGETAFDHPLRSSLEHRVREKAGVQIPSDGETLSAEELQNITCFFEGPGGRVATIFHPDGKVAHDHPKMDVFWWSSKATVDERYTLTL